VIFNKLNFLINCSGKDKFFVDNINFEDMNILIKKYFDTDFSVNIKFCNSIEEFKFFFPFEFKEWICGFFINDIIFVFSPEILEKFTTHKKEDIPRIIFHELVHIVYKQCGFTRNNLFFEGFATFLTKKYSKNKENIKSINLDSINLHDYPILSKRVYADGERVISTIIKNYGKDKLMYVVKNLKNEKKLSHFLSEK